MGIKTNADYVKFYIDLGIQNRISFLRFIQNEKLVLKNKLESQRVDKNSILNGIQILENLTKEINTVGEHVVIKKYESH